MNPITRECQDCQDLEKVLSDIDCTLLDLVQSHYNALVYGTKDCCNESLYQSLLNYRRIVEARTYNPNYPCSVYSSNEILGKARLLSYKTDCSRCPECEELGTTTTTLPPPPGGICVTYLVAPTPLSQTGLPTPYPYSYIDCSGGLVTGVLTQYQVLNICAIRNSITINPLIFSVTEYAEDCSIEPEDCICATLTNEETDPGVAPYAFSYTDCADNTFTDVPLLEQAFTDICVRRSTLVTNFAYSLLNNGACIDDCPTTTTTTIP